MRTLIIFLALFIAISTYAQDFLELESFNKIEVYDGILLNLERADAAGLEFKDINIEKEQIEAQITNGTLKLRVKQDSRSEANVLLNLKYTTLDTLEAYSKAEITTQNLITSDSLFVIIRGGAKAFIDLDIKHLNALVLEGGLLTAEGYAIHQQIKVLTKGTFSGFKLEGKSGNIWSGSGSVAKVNISDEISAQAKFNAYIGYKGTPEFKLKKKFLFGKIVDQND